jgi:hypothetical protein
MTLRSRFGFFLWLYEHGNRSAVSRVVVILVTIVIPRGRRLNIAYTADTRFYDLLVV